MKVPLLDLGPQHQPIHDKLLQAIERVVQSRVFILGPEVEKLEERMAGLCHSRFAIGVSSGTDALLSALMALDIGAGNEVIVPAYSFFATAGVVARIGARPVFVDIDPVTFNLHPGHIESAITVRTRAIIPVHLYGQCADMAPILAIAARHSLAVIEDAAQAIGTRYGDGRRAGSMGTVGCLSFFPTKNLGAFGDAGMVVTSDAALADHIRTLRVHGGKPKYYHLTVGGNFRLDALQAAVLNVKLDYFDAWQQERQDNAHRYRTLFAQSGLVDNGGVQLPAAVYERAGIPYTHTYHQFVIRVPDRDNLRTYLEQNGIGTEVYYPSPLHLQPCFSALDWREGDFPEAERAARETLALPIYPGLGEQRQRLVVRAMQEFYLPAPS